MWAAESITGVFLQPSPFASQGNAVFFVIFNLLGAVFVLTLFISVFMRNYTEQTGVAFLTTDQRAWLELRKILRQISPSKRPSLTKKRETWEEWCYRRAIHKTGGFQRFITAILILHLIFLCLEWYPSAWWWDRTRGTCVLVFVALILILIRLHLPCLYHRIRCKYRCSHSWTDVAKIPQKFMGSVLPLCSIWDLHHDGVITLELSPAYLRTTSQAIPGLNRVAADSPQQSARSAFQDRRGKSYGYR